MFFFLCLSTVGIEPNLKKDEKINSCYDCLDQLLKLAAKTSIESSCSDSKLREALDLIQKSKALYLEDSSCVAHTKANFKDFDATS